MKTIICPVIVMAGVMALTACGSSGGGVATQSKAAPTPQVTPVDPVAPVIPVTPVAPPTDPTLVVYTQSESKSVTSNGTTTTITMTGYCTIYNGNTYCWDDGWHRATVNNALDYWGFVVVNGTIVQGSEGEVGVGDAIDPLENTPIEMTTTLVNQLQGNVLEPNGTEQTMVTDLLANGTQSQVNCTIGAQGVLDCGSFSLTP